MIRRHPPTCYLLDYELSVQSLYTHPLTSISFHLDQTEAQTTWLGEEMKVSNSIFLRNIQHNIWEMLIKEAQWYLETGNQGTSQQTWTAWVIRFTSMLFSHVLITQTHPVVSCALLLSAFASQKKLKRERSASIINLKVSSSISSHHSYFYIM